MSFEVVCPDGIVRSQMFHDLYSAAINAEAANNRGCRHNCPRRAGFAHEAREHDPNRVPPALPVPPLQPAPAALRPANLKPRRLGVVFGTYNRLSHLKRALDSVRRADRVDPTTGIYVVDGGSTDGSREWLHDQPDVMSILQDGPLTGAVRAFNLGFSRAVDDGCEYVFHFNDDAEVVTPGAFEHAMDLMDADPSIGEVAFEFDLRGGWHFDQINTRVYANFGMIRTVAGMAVARAQGDPSGRAWWNPLYRTYGADCEFGMWLWKLGWRVHEGVGLRVHDSQAMDMLRELNNHTEPGKDREDSRIFWERLRTVLV